MQITYQRDIEHCSVSPYIKEVTISEVTSASNSDNLEVIKFSDFGWQAVSQKGLRKVGQKVYFLPPETILPFELSEELEVTKYLSKGKLRVTALRGNRSEGLILEKHQIEKYLPYIMKWEDPPSIAMSGEALAAAEISPYMHRFYKMPNILNEVDTFQEGEEIYQSEKIHGTNFRVGILPHPQTEIRQLYFGSHDVVLKDTVDTVYQQAAKKVVDKLPEDILFFGEIFGIGIQDKRMTYGVKFGVRFFAATRAGNYIPIDELIDICKTRDLPCVPFEKTVFQSINQIRELSEGASRYADHIKEGVVVVSAKHPEKMAKCIGFQYLELNGRKERH